MSKTEFLQLLSQWNFKLSSEAIDLLFFEIEEFDILLSFFKRIKESQEEQHEKIFTSDDIRRIIQENQMLSFHESTAPQDKLSTQLSGTKISILHHAAPTFEKIDGSINSFRLLLFKRYDYYYKLFIEQYPSKKIVQIIKLNTSMHDICLVVRLLKTKTVTSFDKKKKLLFCEDLTGSIIASIDEDEEFFKKKFMSDEIILLEGNVSFFKTRKFKVKKIIFPGSNNELTKFVPAEKTTRIGIISDPHYGSKYFLKEKWSLMINWLKENYEKQKIKYIVFCGDLVEGVGIYPNQKLELSTGRIVKQYSEFAQLLKEIPPAITKIVVPGNHDAVRLAEPQPIFQEIFRNFFDKGTIFFSNPAFIQIETYTIGLYHGKAFDEWVEFFPDLSRERTCEIMELMLEKMHFCPFLGGRNHTAPGFDDPLIIKKIPNLFITGHVHHFDYLFHKGTHMINASAWQGQTPFQKKVNFKPKTSILSLVDISTNKLDILSFE